MNCLILKMDAVLNNPNLPAYKGFRATFEFGNASSYFEVKYKSNAVFGNNKIIASENVTKGGVVGKEFTPTEYSTIKQSVATEVSVYFPNKNDILQIVASGVNVLSFTPIINFSSIEIFDGGNTAAIESIEGCNSLHTIRNISSDSRLDITKIPSTLANCPNGGDYGYLFYGDISRMPACRLTYFRLLNTNVYGSIENLPINVTHIRADSPDVRGSLELLADHYVAEEVTSGYLYTELKPTGVLLNNVPVNGDAYIHFNPSYTSSHAPVSGVVFGNGWAINRNSTPPEV